MTLQLVSVKDPSGGASIDVFGNPSTALGHVRDHLLTAPECEGWVLVSPKYRDVVDPADGDARWRLGVEADGGGGEATGRMYKLYAEAIGEALREAWRLAWWVGFEDVEAAVRESGVASSGARSGASAALGTSGVLVMFERRHGLRRVVVTAYLPGLGTAALVERSRQGATGLSGLPREAGHGMRSSRNRCGGPTGTREDRDRVRRESAWTREQRLFFRVFRPALRFVRRSRFHASDPMRRDVGRDGPSNEYALLRSKLPSVRSLTFERWTAERQRAGVAGGSLDG